MAGALRSWRVAARALKCDQTALRASFRCNRFSTAETTRLDIVGRRALSPLQSRLPSSAAIAACRRKFSSTPASRHGNITPPKPGEGLKITFVDKDGDRHTFDVNEGDNLLDIASYHDLEMEGACEGSCSCSTCHVIVEDEPMFDKMEEATDEENDMLDLAFGLTETSRLGCQVVMTKELDGLVVRLPSMTRNLQASDFESK
ncbi:ferredoxin [Massarina eburnea CBS 473.64]|uniref:Ferredoxin n=1 Tax=Massarina eburnea CBS 473.64 TaxID=1395130 RepID=A0A6A6SI62_9PLEO|nr:ferredoxin [Massarina eburnea CBS 473.64]